MFEVWGYRVQGTNKVRVSGQRVRIGFGGGQVVGEFGFGL